MATRLGSFLGEVPKRVARPRCIAVVLNFYVGPEEAVSIRKGLFVMVTAVKAARHICLSPSRFRDLVDAGVFARMPPGKYDLTTVREAYCLHAQRVMAGRGDDGGKSLSERRAIGRR